MLTIDETNNAISKALEGKDPTWDLMLAATEGAVIGAAYKLGCRVDERFVSILALQSLVESVERAQRAERLGL